MPEWLVFLVMIAVFAALARTSRVPIGIALALAAVAGSLFAGKGVSLRHLVEGAFGYFDMILIIVTATVFIKVLEASGILDSAAAAVLKTFYRSRVLLLLAVMFILMLPGMLTGSSTAGILSAGPIIAPVMMKLGLPRPRTGALIAMGGILGMIAPPVNILVMIMGSGVDMPYVGVTAPLLAIVIPLAIATPLIIGLRHVKTISREEMLAVVPPSLWPRFGLRLYLPFLVLLFLMAAPAATAGRIPDVGIPAAFAAASLVGLVSARRLNFLKVTQAAIEQALPVLAILAGVGMFIQIMTLTGARGWAVVSVLALPSFLLYLGIALSLPAFGGVSTFGSASILGIPFILALAGRNALITAAALSAIAALGDLVPPAAVSVRFASQVVGEERLSGVLRHCLVPGLFQLGVGVAALILATALGRLI